MPDPFRLQVLKAITASLQEIKPTNEISPGVPYTFDLHASVFRGRITYGPRDPLPMISILEAPIPLDPALSRGDNNKSTGAWELLIQGFVDDDLVNPSDPGHKLMAEVKARLVYEKTRDRGTNSFGMGNRVYEVYIGQGAVRPAETPTDKAFFWLTLSIRIVETLDNPFA